MINSHRTMVKLITRFISRYITTADSNPGWRGPLIIGWSGMRGVVSLAAALSIPIYLTDGSAFPQRNLILFITFMVILLTLIVQGLTLPLVIRWVNIKDSDKHLTEKEQDLLIKTRLAEHSSKFLAEEPGEHLKTNRAIQQLKTKLENDQFSSDDGEAELQDFRKIYLQLLKKQRLFLHELNKEPEIDEDIIRKYHDLLDLEEEKFRGKYG